MYRSTGEEKSTKSKSHMSMNTHIAAHQSNFRSQAPLISQSKREFATNSPPLYTMSSAAVRQFAADVRVSTSRLGGEYAAMQQDRADHLPQRSKKGPKAPAG
jgi:hypothetical protein